MARDERVQLPIEMFIERLGFCQHGGRQCLQAGPNEIDWGRSSSRNDSYARALGLHLGD